MKHGSFFSGIGGFDLASDRVGWKNVFNCEIDEYCRKVLKKNFPKSTQYEDINNFKGKKYEGKIDIITGGFPCQDISGAGKGEGIKGSRSGLFCELARVIGEIKPRWAVLENVPALRGRGLVDVLGTLAKLGYDAEWQCISASNLRYPHERNRMWIVAHPMCERPREIFQKIYRIKNNEKNKNKRRSPLQSSNKLKLLDVAQRVKSKGNLNDYHYHDGLPKELDRLALKGLGNAIVPKVAEIIFMAINEAELEKTKT